ncbi:serine/threonine-protein phosphatase 1 regulatory subunit 10-like isoform X2 [Tachypleus tridentatus]|uniref:serine/threonine-protein phosphatase 1 regulatory subunit 10-like isoform X2 n=1 Tax=Tachypleus tridentatus TaxID=6853 RepID=UPI003FD3CE5F
MAPIDPLQLLKALGSLLSEDGGIKSGEEVGKLSSLMKKFSKKLVSRCVYCNVLRSTNPEILSLFLNSDGWGTLNHWIQDAKDTENYPFVLELLKLCHLLPMTVERLKENNTAKLVKSLTKSSNEDIKILASEVVEEWMKLIKGEKAEKTENVYEKLEKNRKKKKREKEQSKVRENKTDNNHDKIREEKIRLKQKIVDNSDLEDVKPILSEEPQIKKVKTDRPKTVKAYQTRFRSTGLEEATPLPKDVHKKIPTVDKTAAVAAAKSAAKRFNVTREVKPPEKRIKPSSLITAVEENNTGPGIKLIPPKPKPVHVLHESAGFMDALVATPTPTPRKKKKASAAAKSPTTPPSPTTNPPRFQFYKDTLETSTDEKEETEGGESKVSERKESTSSTIIEESPQSPTETSAVLESTKQTIREQPVDDTGEADWIDSEKDRTIQYPLQSILSHGKRKKEKKMVKWPQEHKLQQVYFFEMDETERVNVNHTKEFGDMKHIEMRLERQARETVRRLMDDHMEETIPWKVPYPIDFLQQLVVPGLNSQEKILQQEKQQTTLQEIFFNKNMLPDTPQEPEPQLFHAQEPVIIPLEDENNPGAVIDYSTIDLPRPKLDLPPVLSHLMVSLSEKGYPVDHVSDFFPNNPDSIVHAPDIPSVYHNEYNPPSQPPRPQGLIGSSPVHQYNPPPPPPVTEQFYPHDIQLGGQWGPFEQELPPPPKYPENFSPQGPQPIFQNSRPPPMMSGLPRGNRPLPPPRIPDMPPPMRPPPMRGVSGPPGVRIRSQPWVPCRHFVSGGCRLGGKCKFLHPGVNGPPL